MTERDALLAGARLLERGGRAGGNQVFVVETPAGPRVLKLYRGRKSAWREPFRWFGHLLEGKRGTRPTARYETERESLLLWQREGFDVPAVHDEALPESVEPPALWLEYCPGPTLRDVLRDEERALPERAALLGRFGSEVARRQARAIEMGQPLLIHEHASVFHVLVHEDRLVNFDLEGGYRAHVSLPRALEQELGGLIRSILRAVPAHIELLVDAFVDGYVGTAEEAERQLRGIAERGAHGGGLVRWVRRIRGAIRRRVKAKPSKAQGCQLVLDALVRRERAQLSTRSGHSGSGTPGR